MKNRNSKVELGKIVPKKIRLQIYKECLEIKKTGLNIPSELLNQDGLCFLLLCQLWLVDNWKEVDYWYAKAMFPELSSFLNTELTEKTNEQRIEFLEQTIKQLSNV